MLNAGQNLNVSDAREKRDSDTERNISKQEFSLIASDRIVTIG